MDIDPDLALELIDTFSDLYEEIENSLVKLAQEQDREELNRLFRSVHTVKGNAGMCQIEPIVHYAHAIEEVAESLRSGQYPTSDILCQCLQLGMDRLRDLHQRELNGKHYDNLREAEAIEWYGKLAKASAEEIDSLAETAIRAIGGAGIAIDSNIDSQLTEASSINMEAVLSNIDTEQKQKDLEFFREIAERIDQQCAFWTNRTATLLDWAYKVNKIGGNIVNPEQLTATVYLHDIGMSFLPSQWFEQKEKLSPEKSALIKKHPIWGYEYLSRIQGWEEAAKIILHSHEHVDGAGFPQGLTIENIHPGARLFSVIDVFFSLLHGRADHTQNRTILRAVSAINARIDSHFDGMWVQCFNQMIRNEMKTGTLKK